MDARVVWKKEMAFEAHLEGFNFTIDADPQFGGTNAGPRPKGLTLVSLAGCTAMDVVSILAKMRVVPDGFSVSVGATLADDHPKKFLGAVVRYEFQGKDLPLAKLRRAVALSEETYCGVRATLAPTVALSSEIWVNGEKVPTGNE